MYLTTISSAKLAATPIAKKIAGENVSFGL